MDYALDIDVSDSEIVSEKLIVTNETCSEKIEVDKVYRIVLVFLMVDLVDLNNGIKKAINFLVQTVSGKDLLEELTVGSVKNADVLDNVYDNDIFIYAITNEVVEEDMDCGILSKVDVVKLSNLFEVINKAI